MKSHSIDSESKGHALNQMDESKQGLLGALNSPTAWVTIICAWLFYLYEYVLRVSPGVLDKHLMADFQTTATVVGTISGIYYLAYVPLQVPCGMIVDSLGARRVITFSALLCVMGCFCFAFSQDVYMLMFGRILMGMGSACAYISCGKIASEWFTADKFAMLAGTAMLMGTFGGSFNSLFAYVVDLFTWRHAMMIFGGIGVLVSFITWTFIRERHPKSKKNKVNDCEKPKLIEGLKIVMKNPQNWYLGIYGCAMYLPLCAFAEMWGVPFLTELYGVSPKVASGACIAVFIGMGIGSVVSGWVSNYLKSRHKVLSWSALGTLLCFLIIFFVKGLPFWLICIVMFLGGFISGGQTLMFTIAKEHTPLAYSATVMGFVNALVMSSAMIFQPMLGKILDLTWSGAYAKSGARLYSISNYQSAFMAVAIAFVIGFIVIQFVQESYQDLDEAEIK